MTRWLNNNDYKKAVRNERYTDRITAAFVKGVLDNLVYMGKIAYGRGRTEKFEGIRNETHIVAQSDYEIYDRRHEAIIDPMMWTEVALKRQQSKERHAPTKIYSLEHEHILSGILKCPVCGSGMYGSVNRKKKKDGTHYKDWFYYVCKHRRAIDAEVEAIVPEVLENPLFSNVMLDLPNQRTDEQVIQERIAALETQRVRLVWSKDKLGTALDHIDQDDRSYDEECDDMIKRLDALYDKIASIDYVIGQATIRYKDCGTGQSKNAYKLLAIDRKSFPPSLTLR